MRKLLLVLLILPAMVFAQNEKDQNDFEEKIRSFINSFSKLKFSGYVQAQYQNAESNGIRSFSGGNFPEDVKSRFMIRRARFKTEYQNDKNSAVIQIDVAPNGVTIKDAYLEIFDPWTKSIGITTGYFITPFGFENDFSSSRRETPERSRMIQVLFPGQRDLGAQLNVFPKSGALSFFNLKAGIFHGTGGNEVDNNKDFIGRLGFNIPAKNKDLTLSGGVSLYAGKVKNRNSQVIDFENFTGGTIDSISNLNEYFDRKYYGADLQLGAKVLPFGKTILRGEFATGDQPGTAKSNRFYSSTDQLYLRNFLGYYVYFIQSLGKKNELVVKYDVFDPNTDAAENDFNSTGSLLTSEDLKFSTLGFGINHFWDSNIKFMLHYELVKNEETPMFKNSAKDLKDDVLTFRIQYKF